MGNFETHLATICGHTCILAPIMEKRPRIHSPVAWICILACQSVTCAGALSEVWLSERTSYFCCQPLIAATSTAAGEFHAATRHLAVKPYSTHLRALGPPTEIQRLFVESSFRFVSESD